MKKLLFLIASAALFLPTLATAQSVFDGTWKVDMNKVNFAEKPGGICTAYGMYDCKTCTPPYSVKADGSDQPVTGHPYYDTVVIKVVSEREIEETHRKMARLSRPRR